MSNGYLGRKYHGDGENWDQYYIASQKWYPVQSDLRLVSFFEGNMYYC